MSPLSPVPTSTRTLYRLVGVEPTLEGMFDSIQADRLDEIGAEFRALDHFGVPAIALHGRFSKEEASWCADFARLTEWPVIHPSLRGAGLVLLAVDGQVYALAYGDGFRLVPTPLKDRRFGLRFAVRSIDPDDIRAAVARTPGQGRTDIAVMPGGAPIGTLGLDTYTKLVQRMGGRLARPELTVERAGGGRVRNIEGGCGLRLPYGANAASLISDIRTIARVSKEELPHPQLEFVESVVQLQDAETVSLLDAALDHALGTVDGARLAATVPTDCLADFGRARTVGIRFGSGEEWTSDTFELDYVRGRLRFHRPGRRVTALREARVTLYRDRRARLADAIGTDPLQRWVEADLLRADGRRFVLTEGEWHEFDQAYLAGLATKIERLITPSPSVDLPAWRVGDDEEAYNKSVQRTRDGFVCLDRKLVRTPLHRQRGVEICDLLAPDNTLVMVKQASGSGALSHLFNQGVVAVDALLNQPEARAGFADRVAVLGGRRLPEGFLPERVVYAILLKGHAELTTDTLYPFAQVALAHAARALESYGVQVEVVGIPLEDTPEDGCQAA
ncbi:DUF6119 family protein [Streptomyces sp. W16]|uniref:DUF6119 family protein n=1 Tax=Streptomyces sp. W16 TaxID=3076631 RepID=UPI00295B76BC|nr:DUF6119 family protein [Streptomyces sp. W16]MDV9169022.1 DUF6119 family protein [Streptomyces sp. W16]